MSGPPPCLVSSKTLQWTGTQMPAQMPRMEHRAPAKAALLVSLLDKPETTETLVVEDISRHGARAVATLPWRQGDRVLAKAVKGSFQAHARVVYCKPLDQPQGRFAVGLEFFQPTGQWEE